MFLLSAFNDFFPGSYTLKNNLTSVSSFTEGNYYICVSVFRGLVNSNSNGGILSLYSSSKIVALVTDTSFFTCSSPNSNGGAILFSSATGSIALDRVCAYKCSTPFYFGQTLYSTSSNHSILSSAMMTETGRSNFFLSNGHQLVKSLNISKSQCDYETTGSFYSPMTLVITLSTFCDIVATGYSTIYFYHNQGFINYTSFIKMSQNTASYGLVCVDNGGSSVSLRFFQCLFIDNIQNGYGSLFNQGPGAIYLTECFVPLNQIGNVVVYSTITSTLSFPLVYIDIMNCHIATYSDKRYTQQSGSRVSKSFLLFISLVL